MDAPSGLNAFYQQSLLFEVVMSLLRFIGW